MKLAVMRVGALLLVVSVSSFCAAKEQKSRAEEFSAATAHFEQNATDGDVEAVFEAIGNDDGLRTLEVTAPDGYTVCGYSSKSPMGIREFHFESPEPKDTAALRKAFPEGTYMFRGTTASGQKLESRAKLSHRLPPATSFVTPEADAKKVNSKGLVIKWRPVDKVAAYTLEISPSKSSAHIEVKLPPSMTSFAVPEGLLSPGEECQIGIGTVSAAGNVSVIEATVAIAD